MISPALRTTRPSYMPKLWPVPANCVLYLEGQQDAQSATIRDLSGYGNHGTITGATWVRRNSGLYGLSGDGLDDTVNLGNAPSLRLSNNFTVKLWLVLKRTANYECFYTNGEAWDGGWWMQKDYGSYNVHFNYVGTGGGHGGANATVVQNVPAHIVCTFADGLVPIYLNGALQGIGDGGTDTTVIGGENYNLTLFALQNGAYSSQCDLYLEEELNTVWTPAQAMASFQRERHLFGV